MKYPQNNLPVHWQAGEQGENKDMAGETKGENRCSISRRKTER